MYVRSLIWAGRVYRICRYLLNIVGEPAPTKIDMIQAGINVISYNIISGELHMIPVGAGSPKSARKRDRTQKTAPPQYCYCISSSMLYIYTEVNGNIETKLGNQFLYL